MPFKISIATKDGKSWKCETDSEAIIGKSVGESLAGKEVHEGLEGYELTITGASDIAGFAHKEGVEGQNLRRVLLSKGWGMKQKQKGLRRRKTVRGQVLSDKTVQINCVIAKEGSKSLTEVFPDQNKAPEVEQPAESQEAAPQAPAA